MAQKSIRDNQYVIDERSVKPDSLWTLETPTRAVTERETSVYNNKETKKILDRQVIERVKSNERERDEDLEIGREICRADQLSVEKEKQLLKFKKEQFCKETTTAW